MNKFNTNSKDFNFYETLTYFKKMNPTKFFQSELDLRIDDIWASIIVPDIDLSFFSLAESVEKLEFKIKLTNDFFKGTWTNKMIGDYMFTRAFDGDSHLEIFHLSDSYNGFVESRDGKFYFNTAISTKIYDLKILNFNFLKVYADVSEVNNVELSAQNNFDYFNFKIADHKVTSTRIQILNPNSSIKFKKDFNIYAKNEFDNFISLENIVINFNLS